MAVYDFSGPARGTGWIAVETPADALDGAERDGGLILKRHVEHPRGRHQVTVWNRSQAPVEALVAKGAVAHGEGDLDWVVLGKVAVRRAGRA
ncbi:hypothetical protein RM530_15930 [Algiphilus sp. W345]|uniref:Uncharacterized protein n=1 Tax=Banduia mediterranea TaxID=3075609 RepID=A0ABU2WMJ9_9GAMM|nr:hypothetical protein [Algiphilus sp. W345]MDT0498839.1 hypothetical protein [Algiphilus sp. W345]